uniref:ThiF domain-containing protein n=2 Tax=Strongyloides stercoralis TaxID=6248 RepID=A0A913HTE5_STRER
MHINASLIIFLIIYLLRNVKCNDNSIVLKVEKFFETPTHVNNWAVLVDTSRFWQNYRHASNVLLLYDRIKNLGIPDSNIILMMADNIPCNARNPYAGKIFGETGSSKNLYASNVEVDYKDYDVTVINFIKLLTGRVHPSFPRSKRLLSNHQSNVLIYLTGHGGEDFLKFQDNEELTSKDMADAIEVMYQRQRFNELLFISDTCHAESMYTPITTPNVLATSSSLTHEESYSLQVDHNIGVYVNDRMAQDRYDRQIRLWGEDGQEALNHASIHIVGSDGLAFEILKSLVLAGISEFVIIDDAIVEQRDIDTNFFIYPCDIGKKRGQVLKERLLQLSPSVKGHVVNESPIEVFSSTSKTLWNASIIIVSNCGEFALTETSMRFFDDVEKKIFLARTIGFMGMIRISFKEHIILNNKLSDKYPVDLHLTKPWKELEEYVNSIDMENLSYTDHSHVPYSIILMKAYKNYLANHPDETFFVESFKEKKEFEKYILDLRKLNDKGQDGENFKEAINNIVRFMKKPKFPDGLTRLFQDERSNNPLMAAREPIWTYIAAIKIFYKQYNSLPVQGSIPDMLSDTTNYTTLLNIYKTKSIKDAEKVKLIRDDFLMSANVPVDDFNNEMCQKICRNITYMDIQRGSKFMEAFDKELEKLFVKFVVPDEDDNNFDNTINLNATWLYIFKIYDWLTENDSTILNATDEEFEKKLIDSMLMCFNEVLQSSCNSSNEETANWTLDRFKKMLPLKAVTEFVRCRTTQIVPINSIVGGIAAQEVIKVITKQYVPVDNCLIFDGYRQMTETFKL